MYLKKLDIESNINNINITKIREDINLEICSNISKIIILQNKIQKKIIFKEEKESFGIKRCKIKKKDKKIKTEKIILENYMNTINMGFDNGKKYNNYNIINKEKDEDSDNENDKLECEPVPSFILCIQKMNQNSEM